MAVQSPLQPKPSLAPQDDVGSLLAGTQDRSKELDQKFQDTETKIKGIEDKASALTPPKLEQIPPPTPKSTNPAEVWGSAAMLFAGIGSLLTRRPMVSALN